MNIVVIGNGKSATKHTHGGFIDSCDRVVRMNGFRITGFEEYVGNTLDIYAFWSGRFKLHDYDYLSVFNELWFMEPLSVFNTFSDDLKDKYNDLSENHSFKFLDNSNEYSTGWNVIQTAIKYYDEIYITGFDQFLESGWYWDTTTTKEAARVGSQGDICSSENTHTININTDETTHPLIYERIQMLKLIGDGKIQQLDDTHV